MCWDDRTSWTTLAVGTVVNVCVGTVVNVCVGLDLARRPQGALAVAVLSYWQFGLLMQWPEALIWRSKGSSSQPAVALAFWLNVLQPVYGYAALLAFMTPAHRRVVGAIVAAYVLYVLARRARLPTNVMARGGPHLSLEWWKNRTATALYFVASLAVLLAIPSPLLRHTTLAIWAANLLLTQWLYPCSYGSMWCWFIVGAATYALLRARGPR